MLNEGKAIEVSVRQMTIHVRANQVSLDSIMTCLEYLEHTDFGQVDYNQSNMFSLLVTANFLKVEAL